MGSRNFLEVLVPRNIKRLAWRAFGAGVAGLVGLNAWPISQAKTPLLSPLVALERLSYDALFAIRGPRPQDIDPRIVAVGFDSSTESTLGQPWPPRRSVFAKAIRNLSHDGASVIVMDVLFEGATQTEDDRALDKALREAGNVVLASRVERDPNPRVMRKSIIAPYVSDDRKIDFEASATIGLTDTPIDSDTIVRRMVPAFPFQDEYLPSLALAAFAKLHGQPAGGIHLDRERLSFGDKAIPFTGSTSEDPVDHKPIPSVSVAFAGGANAIPLVADLAEVASGKFAKGIFAGKAVFVGATGSQIIKEKDDAFITSATSLAPELVGSAYRRDFPGVLLQAHFLNAIIKDAWITPVSAANRFLFAFVLAWLAIGAAQRYLDWRGGVALLTILLGSQGCAYATFALGGVYLPVASAATIALTLGLFTAWFDRGRLRRKWAGYVSPSVFKMIVDSDEAILRRRCHATVVFIDIRGFTSISEDMDPDDVLDLLNRHFDRIIPLIFAESGSVDRLLGDGLLAVFGAPLPLAHAETRAIRSALEIAKVCREPLEDRNGRAVTLRIGIGVASGDIVAGEIGSTSRHDYTVIGDIVNLAARLQSESQDGEVVLDAETASKLDCYIKLDDIGKLSLKGFSKGIHCFAIRQDT